MSSNVSVRKKQPSNVGPWSKDRTSEERSEFFQRAARAQWGPKKIPPKKANDGPWTWPIDLERYDRSPHLTRFETNMLTRYAEAYKFYRYGRTMDFGAALNRLVRPSTKSRLHGNHHEPAKVCSALPSARDGRAPAVFLGMDD